MSLDADVRLFGGLADEANSITIAASHPRTHYETTSDHLNKEGVK